MNGIETLRAAVRVGVVPVLDIVGTLALSRYFGISFLNLLLVGELVHVAFGVDTPLLRLLNIRAS